MFSLIISIMAVIGWWKLMNNHNFTGILPELNNDMQSSKFVTTPTMEDVHTLILIVLKEMKDKQINFISIEDEDKFYERFQHFLEKELDYPDYTRFM